MLDPAPLYRIDAFTRIELKNRQSPSFVVVVVDRVNQSNRIIQRTSPASVPRVRVVSSTFPLEVVACNTVRNPRTPSSSSSSHRRRRRHPSSVGHPVRLRLRCGASSSSSSKSEKNGRFLLCFCVCVPRRVIDSSSSTFFIKRLFLGVGEFSLGGVAFLFFSPGKIIPFRPTDR